MRQSAGRLLDAFVQRYPAASQRTEFASMRFGDRRFLSVDGKVPA